VVVSYYENTGDFDIYEVEFVFGYAVTSTVASPSLPESRERAEEEEEEEEPGTGGTGGAAIGITPPEGGAPASLQLRMFQDNMDGIRVEVPERWVVDDRFNGTDALAEQAVREHGRKYLATMCPQDQALPATGGSHFCQFQAPAFMRIVFYSFPNLQTRPEFVPLASENRSITTADLVGLYFDLNRELEVLFPPYKTEVSDIDTLKKMHLDTKWSLKKKGRSAPNYMNCYTNEG